LEYSTYKYDALGRRIEKRDKSGNISRYVYDGHNMVAEYDGSNNIVANYVQGLGIDQPISMYRGGEMYWYHTDPLGSVYQMTDEDETVIRTYDYTAFGEIISETGTLSTPFTYTGREHDNESELYYYRARYYDSSVGRFLSRDLSFIKILQRAANDRIREVLNCYSYVKNNPLNLIDPSGEECKDPCPCGTVCEKHLSYYIGCIFANKSEVDVALFIACIGLSGFTMWIACALLFMISSVEAYQCVYESMWCE